MHFSRRTRPKKNGVKQRSSTRVLFVVQRNNRLTSVAILTVLAETGLLFTFQKSMQANRNINLRQVKARIYKLSRRKAPKTQQVCHYSHATKTSGLILLYDTGAGFISGNNFANLGSFAKVSVPSMFIIPCLKLMKTQN